MSQKIAYATDMHSDFAAVESFLQFCRQENPDLVIVSGDLIDRLFDDPAKLQQHFAFQEALKKGHIDETDSRYQTFMREGTESISQQYKRLRKLFLDSGLSIASIPGNYDWIGCLDLLQGFDVHGELVERGGFRVLGYGSSSEVPSMMPSDHTLSYDLPLEVIRGIKQKKKSDVERGKKPAVNSRNYVSVFDIPSEKYQSEGIFAAKAMMELQPDVFISHKPIYQIGDQIPNGSRIGSIPLRLAVQGSQPILATTGHVHEDIDAKYIGKTLVINTGNLGQWGRDLGGYFAVLNANERQIQEFTIYRLDRLRGGLAGSQVVDGSKVTSLDYLVLRR